MRKIHEIRCENGNSVRVYYNHGWGEYVVRFYNHRGVHMDASDYFTDSKEDAIELAEYHAREEQSATHIERNR